MDKPRYKIPIFSVILIFLVLYLSLSALGVFITLNFFIHSLDLQFQTKRNLQAQQSDYKNLLAQIRSLDARQKYQEASASAAQALTKATNPAEQGDAYYWIGLELFRQGDNEAAKQTSLLSNSLDPSYPYGYDTLFAISLKEQNYQQALNYAKAYINALPNDWLGYSDAALADDYLNDKNGEITYLKMAVKLNPSNSDTKKALDALQGESNSVAQPTTSNQSSTANLGYTSQDVTNLAQELNQADKDTATINQSYKGNSTYNQQTVNQIISSISQRKVIGQTLLIKMNKGEALTQNDISSWNQYDALFTQQNTLVKSLENGNGGY